jgi:hypothetical protein
MLRIDPRVHSAVWGLIVIVLGAGWAAFGLTGGNRAFLIVMVVLSIVLIGGAITLLGRRASA